MLTIEACKCGAVAIMRNCFSTSTGHGHKVRCQNGHGGPWAGTINGAARLWNQLQKSSLTIEQAEQAMGIGFSVKDAMRIYANETTRVCKN